MAARRRWQERNKISVGTEAAGEKLDSQNTVVGMGDRPEETLFSL